MCKLYLPRCKYIFWDSKIFEHKNIDRKLWNLSNYSWKSFNLVFFNLSSTKTPKETIYIIIIQCSCFIVYRSILSVTKIIRPFMKISHWNYDLSEELFNAYWGVEKFPLNLSRGHLKLQVKVNFDVNFLRRTFHEGSF